MPAGAVVADSTSCYCYGSNIFISCSSNMQRALPYARTHGDEPGRALPSRSSKLVGEASQGLWEPGGTGDEGFAEVRTPGWVQRDPYT